jgi:hypothetical protein
MGAGGGRAEEAGGPARLQAPVQHLAGLGEAVAVLQEQAQVGQAGRLGDRVGADAQVGPAQVEGHIGRLAVGRELVADLEAEQVAVEAERSGEVAGDEDREQLLEHADAFAADAQARPRLAAANRSAQRFQVSASSGAWSSRAAAAWSWW